MNTHYKALYCHLKEHYNSTAYYKYLNKSENLMRKSKKQEELAGFPSLTTQTRDGYPHIGMFAQSKCFNSGLDPNNHS
jgi:hypothetical protein